MREQVCIVLNERESTKAKAAEALEKHLRAQNITTSRIKVDQNINSAVKQRSPEVVVLDYLLGDYSTGLDVMAAFRKVDPERRPSFLFYTDEPSVQVAVEAMKQGARDYVTLDDPQALGKLASTIKDLVRPVNPLPRASALPGLDDLVCTAPKSLALLRRLKESCAKAAPIILLSGKSGSGLSTLASAISVTRGKQQNFDVFDARSCDEDILEFFGLRVPRPARGRLGLDRCGLLEHAEDESGSLIRYIQENSRSMWHDGNFLVLTTNSPDSIKAWSSLAGIELIQVPELADRIDDIPALAQRAVREVENFIEKKPKPLPNEVLTWLKSQNWPGDIRQLRACIVDASITATLEDGDLLSLLVERKELWDLEAQPNPSKLDPIEAAYVFEFAGGDYRRAAALLGCSAKELHKTLQVG